MQHKIILASKSPRRKELLASLDLDFTVEIREVEENFPDDLPPEETALYIAQLKANAFSDILADNTVVITADTVVILNEQILGKPQDEADAKGMLKQLSGNQHRVITGVVLKSNEKTIAFSVSTKIHFKELTKDQIEYYVAKYQPLDKAGAYGVQEWIGHIGIDYLEGSYTNVVGFPLVEVYDALRDF
ncbi:MAG: septum formation protein Maf [Flavobacteriales bacterium]|nr:septum formation protein Maf [Flavobacteriales bacterium]